MFHIECAKILEEISSAYPCEIYQIPEQLRCFITYNPTVSIKNFVERLNGFTQVESSQWICTLICIDKLSIAMNTMVINKYTQHKICSVALILSLKLNVDNPYNFSYLAQVCGLTSQELLELEIEFLKIIDWTAYVDGETYQQYVERVNNNNSI